MENNLTLEELAIAFTYDYSLQYFDDEREILHNNCKIIELRKEEMTIANNEYQYDVKFGDVKIIAIPLSDITKDELIEFYELDTIDLEIIDVNEWIEELVQLITKKDKFQLSQFQLLFKWHFDVFSLIEKGKAININTIN